LSITVNNMMRNSTRLVELDVQISKLSNVIKDYQRPIPGIARMTRKVKDDIALLEKDLAKLRLEYSLLNQNRGQYRKGQQWRSRLKRFV